MNSYVVKITFPPLSRTIDRPAIARRTINVFVDTEAEAKTRTREINALGDWTGLSAFYTIVNRNGERK